MLREATAVSLRVSAECQWPFSPSQMGAQLGDEPVHHIRCGMLRLMLTVGFHYLLLSPLCSRRSLCGFLSATAFGFWVWVSLALPCLWLSSWQILWADLPGTRARARSQPLPTRSQLLPTRSQLPPTRSQHLRNRSRRCVRVPACHIFAEISETRSRQALGEYLLILDQGLHEIPATSVHPQATISKRLAQACHGRGAPAARGMQETLVRSLLGQQNPQGAQRVGSQELRLVRTWRKHDLAVA